jgi:hypothetical protein
MSAAYPARHDFYSPPHKGLRWSLSHLLLSIGGQDFTDQAGTAALLQRVRLQLEISAAHLAHEDKEIHTAMEARAPGSSAELERDHAHHRAAFVQLERLIAAVEAAPVPERPPLGRQLYLAFSQFVADDLAHMAEEELVTLPLLHRLFTDQELMAMEARIVAAIPPERMMVFLQVMLPAMNPAERFGFLSFARGSAPPEAFNAMIEHAVRPSLPANDWAALAGRLGLAA